LNTQTSRHHLDVGRVEHDSDGGAKGLGGEVVSESSSDHTGVTVGSGNLAPHDSDLGASDLLLGSVDVSNSLSDVELGLVGVGDALNLDERNVGVHNSFASLVRDMLSLNVDCVSMDHKNMVRHRNVETRLYLIHGVLLLSASLYPFDGLTVG
jgi:hypothetical protein